MTEDITYVGLDTHKETISVALARAGRSGVVQHFGQIANRPAAVERLARKLAEGGHRRLRFSYEAGPCGYGLHRHLHELGHDCIVAAPSLIPRAPGERVQTDRRDAMKLARQDRAGELVAIWVPDAAHEAMRDLVRGREAAVETLMRARQQLLGFLLRQGRIYPGKTHWTQAHRRWLASLAFEHLAQRTLFHEQIEAIGEAQGRRDRLTGQIESLVAPWERAPLVAALMAMRGIALVSAMTLVAEIGDFRRFAKPCQLTAFLGLVPSEASSGKRVRRGAITRAGNARVRRILDEAAWSYLGKPRIGLALGQRQAALAKPVRDIAWKAQLRLCHRFRHLLAKGKSRPLAVTAVAREMVGFLWAIARQVEPAADATVSPR
jgi:transposase